MQSEDGKGNDRGANVYKLFVSELDTRCLVKALCEHHQLPYFPHVHLSSNFWAVDSFKNHLNKQVLLVIRETFRGR